MDNLLLSSISGSVKQNGRNKGAGKQYVVNGLPVTANRYVRRRPCPHSLVISVLPFLSLTHKSVLQGLTRCYRGYVRQSEKGSFRNTDIGIVLPLLPLFLTPLTPSLPHSILLSSLVCYSET